MVMQDFVRPEEAARLRKMGMVSSILHALASGNSS